MIAGRMPGSMDLIRALMALALAVLGLTALAADPVRAHGRSESASIWTITGPDSLQGTFAVDRRRATLLYGLGGNGTLEERLGAHLAATISVSRNGTPCVSASPQPLRAATGMLRMRLSVTCAEKGGHTDLRFYIDSFFALSAQHRHMIRVDGPDGSVETLLSGARRVFDPSAEETGPPPWAGFVQSGFSHVLSGPDHLAFIAALLLLCTGFRSVVLTLTGFTLGHSITLGLVAFEIVRPMGAGIEALIGFSIAYAALEAADMSVPQRKLIFRGLASAAALWAGLGLAGMADGPANTVLVGLAIFLAAMAKRAAFGETAPGREMAGFAALFGLAHGAGFAGGLQDLGLEPGAMLGAVIGFNIGVEAGQIAVAAVVLGLVALSWVWPPVVIRWAREVSVASLLGLGLYWFMLRSLMA